MTAISGSAAAVTGAASGIGRALALELATRGCDLALADRDEAGLQQVAAEIGKIPARKVSAAPRRCRRARPDPGFCEGRHRGASRPEHRHQQCRRRPARRVRRGRPGADGVADQHQFLGRGARHARLPAASFSATEAHIVNLSSIFGIIAPPGQTAYCAAKFAVRGFSESLRHELAMANSPVRLSVVHPGGVSPTSSVTPEPATASPTMRAARNRSSGSMRSRRPRRRSPRSASSPASRKTSRAF